MATARSAKTLDGRAIARRYREKLSKRLISYPSKPSLAVVRVGDDPASEIYVRNKRVACEKAGIESTEIHLASDVSEEQLLAKLIELNQGQEINGILLQLPLPKHLQADRMIAAIDPLKDVDGFHPENQGRLLAGVPRFEPCTPKGILYLLSESGFRFEGARAVVVGRSQIVGRPVALMLTQRHATVTLCHSRTRNIEKEIEQGDLVVAAIGKPQWLRGEWIKEGAVVIDVGINRTVEGRVVGDCDYNSCATRAAAITPVPGGVGPLTIAMLLENTRIAYCLQNQVDPDR